MNQQREEDGFAKVLPKSVLLLLAGGGSGAITKTATAPLERTKTLMQIQGMTQDTLSKPKYTGIVQTLVTVVREEGFSALWWGNNANVARIVPVYALRLGCNDIIKQKVAGEGNDVRNLRAWQNVLAGTLAGFVQQVVCYPLEVIKTRMTLGQGSVGTKYSSILDCAQKVVRHEGEAGLYKGLVTSVLYGAPYVGAQMSMYTEFQRLLWSGARAESSGAYDGSMKIPIWVKLVAGAGAGVAAQTLVYPLQLVRTWLQSDGVEGRPKKYYGMIDCIKQVSHKEGLMAF